MRETKKESKLESGKISILSMAPAALVISGLGFLDIIPIGNITSGVILIAAIASIISYFTIYRRRDS